MHEELNLRPGELLLWSGKPERRRPIDRGDAFTVPLFVAWLGFVAFWAKSAEASGAPPFFMQFAFFFPAIVLIQVLGQYVVRFIRLGSTRYAITDRRVIEIVDRPRRRRTEGYLRDLAPPVLRPVDAESIGSIAFGQFPRSWATTKRNREQEATIILRHVTQPRYVRDLVADAQARAAGPAADRRAG